MPLSTDLLRGQLSYALAESDLPGLGAPERDGLYDVYALDEHTLLVLTDRAGAPGPVVGPIPFKGEVVARLATWWVDVAGDLAPSPVVRVFDPQVLLLQRVEAMPVRFGVYAHLDGALARAYAGGACCFDGVTLPHGLSRRARLERPLVVPLAPAGAAAVVAASRDEVLERGLAAPAAYDEAALLAGRLFERGQQLARARGLLLGATRYQFGRMADGSLCVANLLHTPDTSSYAVVGDGQPPRWLDEESVLERTLDGGGAPEELRLSFACGHLQLGECLLGELTPHAGPVINRLTCSLSTVGLLA